MSATLQRPAYRLAAEHLAGSSTDLTRIDPRSSFAARIDDVFEQFRPRRVIETGTYRGDGTTAVIASALRRHCPELATFYSIEVNPSHFARAVRNLSLANLHVNLLNGLSVPRALLPAIAEIEARYVAGVEADGVFVDHAEAERARLYFGETDFPGAPDDLLGRCMRSFDGRPDFVLLDSGGHVGFAEFQYWLSLQRGPCHVALDDIRHVKHHQSFRALSADPRFTVVAASDEKFGYCVARFTPDKD